MVVLVALGLFSAAGYGLGGDRSAGDGFDGAGLDKVQVDNEKWTFGKLITFQYRGYDCAMIVPRWTVDKERRCVYISPGSLAYRGEFPQMAFYVETLLAKGFHVAGIEMGGGASTAGSPRGAQLHYEFYQLVTKTFNLHEKARLVGQSNGGLNQYGWAFRHPECVDRVLGLLAVTDFRTWPSLDNLVDPTPPFNMPEDIAFNMTLEELLDNIKDLNPIDNLAPLAKAGVKIFHIHGDDDGTVPIQANALEFARRYRALGGDITLIVAPNYGHWTPQPMYNNNQQALRFLIAD
jgi:pimeloyl-ACP methyl ester carboxylesterase